MIKSIVELEERLVDYDADVKNKLIELVSPYFTFYDYMVEKYNLSYEEIEIDSQLVVEKNLKILLEESNLTEEISIYEFYIKNMGSLYKDYAISKGYENGEEIEIAIVNLLEISLKTLLSNGGK